MNKSQRTKKLLYRTAIDLFVDKGFEETTMRAIAKKADVAPGAIYYYFSSKESIIQDYYEQSHDDHEELLGDFLQTEIDFEKRLRHVVTTKIEVALPYKELARALYRVAANPKSPSSPFSEQSKELRLKSLNIFKEVVTGSADRFQPEVRELLPNYLWFYQMGIILFWLYDESENSKKTFELIEQTVPLIAWMNTTLQSTWSAPFRKRIIATLKNFEPDFN